MSLCDCLISGQCGTKARPTLAALKASTKPVDGHRQLGYLARSAHTFLLQQASSTTTTSLFRLQRKSEKHAADLVAPTNDALILDCALFFHQSLPGRVGVLSNDNNLCIQVLAEQMPALSLKKRDAFPDLLQALHPDLPALFGVALQDKSDAHAHQSAQPAARMHSVVGHEDMDMMDGSPASSLAADTTTTPDDLLSSISNTLSQILPYAVYTECVAAQGQDTTDHLLRHRRPPEQWNAAQALEVLEKHWSSLEHLWDTHVEEDPGTDYLASRASSSLSSPGSAASRWSPQTPTSSTRRPAEDGLGLTRSQMRDFRQSSLRSMMVLMSGSSSSDKKANATGSNNSLASYATAKPDSWRAAHWSTLWVDLELLLLRGRLLRGNKRKDESMTHPSDQRQLVVTLLQDWRRQAREMQERPAAMHAS